VYGWRSDTRGGLIFRVSIEHEEIQVLCRHLACEGIRTDQSIAITTERKMDWNIGCRGRSGLELANVACDRGIRGLEPVIINGSWLQAAEMALYGKTSRRASSPCGQCRDSRNERWLLADLHVDCRRLRVGLVVWSCPDEYVVGWCGAGSDSKEDEVGIGARRFEHVACDEHQGYDPK